MKDGLKAFNELIDFVSKMSDDIEKFYSKKNKAAGTRARKDLQALKSFAQEIRLDIQKRKSSS